ncbi:M20/M25/M40 family metallo-hydrolase [Mesorhizobium sp.]|uniref:M20/M25/M40 family metallo-hydrolase n=1 Tax=Mesorhizobium sp. TaxID=1871066 RepID=UPI003390618E
MVCALTWTRCRSRKRPVWPTPPKNKGLMHACGHDGHTAMLLGARQANGLSRHADIANAFAYGPPSDGARSIASSTMASSSPTT